MSIIEIRNLSKQYRIGTKAPNPNRPDGTSRKLLDVSRINSLGWKAKTPLRKGVEKTYEWYKGSIK
ncbi:MAG: hypothetical protein Q7T83_00675 [Thermodesulfovibrionales bacterium]|nr:hypothetical protein [Thermodesulfovibrionales bacterium]